MIIYTASDQSYADSVVNYIDPTKEFFKYRLYRHNCVEVKLDDMPKPIYVKDLRIIKNVKLEDMVIIDNSVLSFAFHLDNGIPILPYYQNKDDIEMETLKNYLIKLSKCDNLQVHNGANFNLTALLEEAQSQREEEIKEEQSTAADESSKKIEDKESQPNKLKIVKDNKKELKLIAPTKKNSKIQTKIFELVENFKKDN